MQNMEPGPVRENTNKSPELLAAFMRKNDVSGVHLGKWCYPVILARASGFA